MEKLNLAIIVALSILLNVVELGPTYLLGTIVDDVTEGQVNYDYFWYFGFLIVLSAVLHVFTTKVLSSFVQEKAKKISSEWFSRIINRDFGDIKNYNTGKIMSSYNRGVQAYQSCIQYKYFYIIPMAIEVSVLTIFGAVTISFPAMVLIYLIMIISLLAQHGIVRKIYSLREQSNTMQDTLSGMLFSFFQGIKIIKISKSLPFFDSLLGGVLEKNKKINIDFNVVGRIHFVSYSIVTRIIILAILILSATLYIPDGTLSIGQFVMLMSISMTLVGVFFELVDNIVRLKNAKIDLQTIEEILNEDVQEKTTQPFAFKVAKNKKTIKSIAIFGSSGSGKTSMIEGLLGLNNTPIPEEIKTVFDAIKFDVNDCHYVPQEDFIFDASVLANVTLGDDRVDTRKMDTFIDRLHLQKRLNNDTVINDFGDSLSGGEKRRINLMRAFVSDKKYIIIDEPTNHLNKTMKQHVWDCIFDLMSGDKIVIVITHDDIDKKHFDCIFTAQ